MTAKPSNEKKEQNKMQDFNDYSKNFNENLNEGDIAELVKRLSQRFDGKSQNDLLKAIYEEALRGKKNGTLTNEQIDNFQRILSPMLDDKKRKMLNKVVEEIKKI